MARRSDADGEILTGSSGEIVAPDSRFDKSRIASVTSLDDALALATEVHGDVVTSDGWRIADKVTKHTLVGKPAVLMEWDFVVGTLPGSDRANEYVQVRLVVQELDGTVTKWVVNDSSTGIYKELRAFTSATGRQGGVKLGNGIRRSSYWFDPHRDGRNMGGPIKDSDYEALSPAAQKQIREAHTFYTDITA